MKQPACWGEETWLRAKDVVVSAAPRSGTTGLLYCAHLMRTKGSDAPEMQWLDVPGALRNRYALREIA